ncbi:hypothetical protein HK104_009826 [Borealophlyctis nickersoniae]|nr:hypothetical protein HK104_009826 [Borealophlyctis nickersoniae]
MLVASSKTIAAAAACCSILDYLTTAVVSAASASTYFQGEFGLINVFGATVGVLIFFAALNMLGIKESADVSLGIFVLHCASLTALAVASVVQWARIGSGVLAANWHSPSPTGNAPLDIFYGFCVGMLGVTGFETSVNYIEEQKPGVFPKTMRNMAYLVLFVNPVISFLALTIIPRELVIKNPNNLMSIMGDIAVGRGLRTAISIDSVIVLCGGVLTAFVGVGGLMEHMASDGLLPRLLLRRNRFTKSHHWVVLTFLLLCLALVGVARGDVTYVSLVFALSFLSVLLAMALANLLLKYKRGRLKRSVEASWGTVIFGLLAVCVAIAGNAVYNPNMIGTFAAFFAVLFAGMLAVASQVRVLKLLIFFADAHPRLRGVANRMIRWVIAIKAPPVAFFTNHDEIHVLNKAVLYVQENETTMHMYIVHMYEDESQIPPNLEANCRTLDHIYPKIQMDLILIKAKFSPASVAYVANEMGIPRNQCYITCPGEKTDGIGTFGGVRVIML